MPCGRRGTVNAQVRMRSNPAPQPSRVHLRIDIDLTSAGLAWYGGPPPSLVIFACRNHCYEHDPMLEAAKQCSVVSWSTRLCSGRAVRGVRLCRWVWRAHWIGGATLLPHHTNPSINPTWVLPKSSLASVTCQQLSFVKACKSHRAIIPSPPLSRCMQAGAGRQAGARKLGQQHERAASKQAKRKFKRSINEGRRAAVVK